jgi:hypothetical protein
VKQLVSTPVFEERMKSRASNYVSEKVALSVKEYQHMQKYVNEDGFVQMKRPKATETSATTKSHVISKNTHLLALEAKEKTIHKLRQQIHVLKKAEKKACDAGPNQQQLEQVAIANETCSTLISKNQALINRIRDLQAAAALHESQMAAAVSKAEVQLMKQMMGNKLQTPNSHDKSGSGSHHLGE